MTHHDPTTPPSAPSPGTQARWVLWPLAAALLIGAQASSGAGPAQQGNQPASDDGTLEARLVPTAHPAVPPALEHMWYVGNPATPPAKGPVADLARGIEVLDESGDARKALPLLNPRAHAKTPLADYATYYRGVALQKLERYDEADEALSAISGQKTAAYLPEAALYRRAEIREAKNDPAGAVAIYEQLLARPPMSMPSVLIKLATAAAAAGDRTRALAAARRVIDEFTLAGEAEEADRLIAKLEGFALDSPLTVAAELGRAEALYNARKYDLARTVYRRIADRTEGEARDRVTLRLAQIQLAKGDRRQAREVFKRYVGHPALGVEAQFGLLAVARALGAHAEANRLTEDFVAKHPTHPLAEQALNEMARRYVLDDEDGKAAEIYTEMIDRFPAGAYAERGAWKAGWWAYRQRNFAETIRVFERGAATFPRSDYRPSWLYWTGRAYDQLGVKERAIERYRLTATDYLNSYYGRLAWKRLEEHDAAIVTPGVRRVIDPPPAPPKNLEIIRRLIAAGLYVPALNELRYAQRMWGDSAPLQATIAYVHNRMGNLRPGIIAMRRAYPQFMAAGGEDLPREILRIIFPLEFWPLLKGNADAKGIDPYVIAALAAQESTFDPQIRSSANAIGLMQIIPPTGRRLARQIGMRRFSVRSLENPEINARLGTHYFASMVKEFGGYHYALAGYNAGEHRVRRWNKEAPGLPQDEWVDNIPFPETQNYVKRILGTAEDYRRLYGETQTSDARSGKKPGN